MLGGSPGSGKTFILTRPFPSTLPPRAKAVTKKTLPTEIFLERRLSQAGYTESHR